MFDSSEVNYNPSANLSPNHLDRALGISDVWAFSSVSNSNSLGIGSSDLRRTALLENPNKVQIVEEPPRSNPAKITAANVDPLTGITADLAGNDLSAARDIGTLIDYQKFTDAVGSTDPNDFYRFNLSKEETISVFLNGLAAGTTIQLLDGAGNIIDSSTNKGSRWSLTNNDITGGSITASLGAGTYYLNVTPAKVTGNPVYDKGDEYSIMFQPHEAANTVAVAASDTVNKNGADYFANGFNDRDVINQAIAQVGASGGGTVLLLGGTFNISNNILITYDNVTLSGVGWDTVLKQANNTQFQAAGMLRSTFNSNDENIAKPRFSNQHFRHIRLDGNKANQTTDKNAYGNFGTYENSSFEDLRVHDFGSYGFDPHENSTAGVPTVRLTIKDSLADHNGDDGVTIDNCLDSLITGNISDSNRRHGFNIVTASRNNTFSNNITSNNGGNGFTIQAAVDLSRTSDANILIGNISQFNQRIGIYVERADNTQILDNIVRENKQHGIRLRGSSYSLIRGNQLLNNSQELDGKYNEIYLDDEEGNYSTNNSVENNNIFNRKANRASYGIAEKSANDDFNTLFGNSIRGTKKGTKILGKNSRIIS